MEAVQEERGLKKILNDSSAKRHDSEEMLTADAIPSIIRTLANVPDAQVENVFHSVIAIKRTANKESTAAIGEELTRLSREREQQSKPKARRWLW